MLRRYGYGGSHSRMYEKLRFQVSPASSCRLKLIRESQATRNGERWVAVVRVEVVHHAYPSPVGSRRIDLQYERQILRRTSFRDRRVKNWPATRPNSVKLSVP